MSEDNELVGPCGCKEVHEQQEYEDSPCPTWIVIETHLCDAHVAKLEALRKARAA